MSASSIQVSGLAKQKLTALRRQATEAGMSAELYEGILLEKEARNTTFDDLYAPVQEHFRRSGMKEEELDQLVDAARTRHHRRSAKRG